MNGNIISQIENIQRTLGMHISSYNAFNASIRPALAGASLTAALNNTFRGMESTMAQISPALSLIDQMRLSSNMFKQINSASLSISEVFRSSAVLNDIAQRISMGNRQWQQNLIPFKGIHDAFNRARVAIQYHGAYISQVSMLAEHRYANVNWDIVSRGFAITNSASLQLQHRYEKLSQSYANYFSTLQSHPLKFASLPPIATIIPPVEMYYGAELLTSTTHIRTAEEFSEQEQVLKNKLDCEREETLSSLLEELDPNLLEMLYGARDSIISTNPDHARHVVISLRELFTHVLHKIAPDDKVKQWTSDPRHYDKNGRLTREARLTFIYFSIHEKSLSDFIKHDIDSILTFLALFQRGTHKIGTSYTDNQLYAIAARMKSTLHFLIALSKI